MKYQSIIENRFGFYEIYPKPSHDDLKEYYNLKYYQNQSGNYRNNYSSEEITYFKNKEVQKLYILENYLNVSKANILDIGCGEGFSISHFYQQGWDVLGIDFSSFGIKYNNPEMEKFFIEGDLISIMKDLQGSKTFKVITLNNLLEHVHDPENTIELACNLLDPFGVLIIEVPNDFSRYQKFLKDNHFIEEDFWVAYPDHLSYFTKTSLNNLLNSKNMTEVFSLADFPIDIFLSNPQSNYVTDKTKGKDAHKSRILVDNFLNNESIEKTIKLYEAMAQIGFGRQIISFFRKNIQSGI